MVYVVRKFKNATYHYIAELAVIVMLLFTLSSDEVIVYWNLEEAARDDLTPLSGQLNFEAGQRMKSIILRALPDQILEGNEDYTITLNSATGGAEISPIAGKAVVCSP